MLKLAIRTSLFLMIIVSFPLTAGVVLTFEGLQDLTPIRDLYQDDGVTFVRATAIMAGVTLNEFEFPPHSGSNVVFDNTGNILVDFQAPVTDISAYFTYATPVTITAFDSNGNVLGSQTSSFFSNMLVSGDPGSSPNEFLQFSSPGANIAGLSITGDPNGSSFVMDDFAFSSTSEVPEPSTIPILAVAGFLIGYRSRSKVTRREVRHDS